MTGRTPILQQTFPMSGGSPISRRTCRTWILEEEGLVRHPLLPSATPLRPFACRFWGRVTQMRPHESRNRCKCTWHRSTGTTPWSSFDTILALPCHGRLVEGFMRWPQISASGEKSRLNTPSPSHRDLYALVLLCAQSSRLAGQKGYRVAPQPPA